MFATCSVYFSNTCISYTCRSIEWGNRSEASNKNIHWKHYFFNIDQKKKEKQNVYHMNGFNINILQHTQYNTLCIRYVYPQQYLFVFCCFRLVFYLCLFLCCLIESQYQRVVQSSHMSKEKINNLTNLNILLQKKYRDASK